MSIARREGDAIRLPGIASAHSHAFQRGLRGLTQGRAQGRSFWSWRALMYRFAERVDPESLYALSRLAFAELARHGVTAVGEFHYLWHQPGGAPYEDRLLLPDAVVRAARDVGIRIALLRVLYQRAGAGRPPEGAQRRFADAELEDALSDVLALRARYASDDGVLVGIAPHSVRAVSADWLREAAAFAETHALPFHMHVAEQRREIDECLGEHGRRPVELLAELGLLGPRFVAIHATHLTPAEARLLATSRVCVCRTTERDLGDGAPDLVALRDAGARICVGADSHARSDPFEELAALELDERVRSEARQVAMDGEALLRCASRHGYDALGMESLAGEDAVLLDASDVSLVGAPDEGRQLDDLVAFGASGRAVRTVRVGPRVVVSEGCVPQQAAIREAYEQALRSLRSS